MKKVICKECNKKWFVDHENINQLKFCPYCGMKIQKKVEFHTIDSLEKLLISAIDMLGNDSFSDMNRLNGLMNDLAPNLNKEIRIFSKNIYDDYASLVNQIIYGNSSEVPLLIKRLKIQLVEDEGLNDYWANIICDGVRGAAKYVAGEYPSTIVNLEIEDVVNNKAPESQNLIGSTIEFGTYPYDLHGKRKPIKWKVLANNHNVALLLSEECLDCQPFESWSTIAIWENSSLRKWLNTTFINDAFTDEEKSRILETAGTAQNNSSHGKNIGIGFEDKVFLLSIQQVQKYLNDESKRIANATPYARTKGVVVDSEHNSTRWWLQSPGRNNMYAACINFDGTISYNGYGVHNVTKGVRPALSIKIQNV